VDVSFGAVVRRMTWVLQTVGGAYGLLVLRLRTIGKWRAGCLDRRTMVRRPWSGVWRESSNNGFVDASLCDSRKFTDTTRTGSTLFCWH
jgi:hypothetical protein